MTSAKGLKPDGASLRAAEFFAGIGLVRQALEEAGVEVVFANDINPIKGKVYVANFGEEHFVLGDIAKVPVESIPDVDIATASFPCTDLSLAGNRAGLNGAESGAFWLFADLLQSLAGRAPRVILLENVAGLGTSRQGADLRDAISRLNELGYTCDLFQVDASRWVPQSRVRVFVVGAREPTAYPGDWGPDELRPAWISSFVRHNQELVMRPSRLKLPPPASGVLADYIDRQSVPASKWWDEERLARFQSSLSPIQAARLEDLRRRQTTTWRTAYRRTRKGVAVWEIRNDEISGCLRTARGGSSRQALVEAGRGRVRVRWMSSREYAALMGAAGHILDVVSENQALFGLGDAVAVPAMRWLLSEYVVPLARGDMGRAAANVA